MKLPSMNLKATLERDSRGFTLIELLVVIAIIAVLSAIILAALASSQKGARDTTRISDLDSYKKALVQYEGQTGFFPASAGNWITANSSIPCPSISPPSPGTKYLEQCLLDKNNTTTGAALGNSHLQYRYVGSTAGFAVCANLERKPERFRVSPTFSGIEANVNASACTAGP